MLRATAGVLLASLTLAPVCAAQESEGGVKRAPVPADYRRSWLFLDEPSTPTPLRPVFALRTTYTGNGSSPTRPFAANTGNAGFTGEVAGEVALAPWVSIRASGATGTVGGVAPGEPLSAGVGAIAALHLATPTFARTRLSLTSGYLREMDGGNGLFARVAATHELGRFRFGASVHMEHVFGDKRVYDAADGEVETVPRDAVDVMVNLGTSVRVAGPMRLLVEYVAQDFEGLFDTQEAEGGFRHFLSSGVSFELFDRRLAVSLGPALGLSPQSPRVMGRAAMSYAF